MPLSEAERKKCVETLLAAEKDKKQAVQLSVTYPHITIEDSYAISTAVAQHKIKGGAKLIGHKVGLTSKAMQASSQINEPDYGSRKALEGSRSGAHRRAARDRVRDTGDGDRGRAHRESTENFRHGGR